MRKEQKQPHTETRNVTVEVACDWCGKKAPNPNDREPWSYFNKDEAQHEKREPSVEFSAGYSLMYDGGGQNRTIRFDICPECFADKLVPLLAAQGVQPTVETYDF